MYNVSKARCKNVIEKKRRKQMSSTGTLICL